MQLIQVFARELRLRKALAAIRDSFDYVFIDCPPSLSLLTVNALCAADSVIVPMQCEYFALEGIASLTETIRELRSAVNPIRDRGSPPHDVRQPQQACLAGL